MLYKALHALSFKGTRIERGEIIDTDEAFAASVGPDSLAPVEFAPVEPAPTPKPEVLLEDLTKAELAELCDKAGLSTKGTKADLLERYRLSA